MKKFLFFLLMTLTFLVPRFASGTEERDRALGFPVKAYNNGNYSFAIKGFKKFLEKHPSDSESISVKKWLAYSYRKTKRPERAFTILKDIFEKQPSTEVFGHLVDNAKKLEKIDKLLPLLNKNLLQRFPGLQNYFIALKVDRDQLKDAERTLRSLPSEVFSQETKRFLDQTERKESINKIKNSVQNGHWNHEFRDILKSSKIATDRIEDWILQGTDKLWNRNDYRGILKFTRNVPDNRLSPVARFYRAESLVKLEQSKTLNPNNVVSKPDDFLSAAQEQYEMIIETEKYVDHARNAIAWIEYWKKNHIRALEQISKLNLSRLSSPLYEQATLLKGRILNGLGQKVRAIELYQRAIDGLDGEISDQAKLDLAWIHYEKGHFETSYSVASQINPDRVDSPISYHKLRANLAVEKEDSARASSSLQKAIKLVNSRSEKNRLRYRLGKLYIKNGKTEKAYETLKLTYRNNPDDNLTVPVALALLRTSVELQKHDEAKHVVNQNSNFWIKVEIYWKTSTTNSFVMPMVSSLFGELTIFDDTK